MADTLEEIKFLCRICLQKNNVIDISQIHIEQVDVQTAFQTVFHEKFLDEPYKPNNLCKRCVDSLREFYKFLNIYKESKRKLEKFILELNQATDIRCVGNNFYGEIKEEKVNVNITESEQQTNNEFEIIIIEGQIDKEKSTDEKLPLSKNEKYIKCDLCDKWIYRCSFFRHKRSVHNSTNEGSHSMQKDEQVQIKLEKTINNLQTTEKTLCCELCDEQTFATKATLVQHYKNVHDGLHLKSAGYEECNICGKLFHPKFMLMHKVKKHNLKNQSGNSKKTETKPEQLPRSKRKCMCDICGKQVSAPGFSMHKRLHAVDKTLEKKMCELCGKQFSSTIALKEHFQSVHEENPFQCNQCAKSFIRKQSLRTHIKKKHCPNDAQNQLKGNNSKFVICNICGKKTPKYRKRSLILHDAFHRLGHKVMCPILECELTFPDEPSRLNHLANEHEKLTCNQCHKDFFDPLLFKAHCQVHIWNNNESKIKSNINNWLSSEKKECLICSQFFDNNEALAEHLLKVHKIYWCLKGLNCFKMCPSKSAYYFHIAKHKNEANHFKCKLCPREFTTKSSYLVHEKGHNKSDGPKCHICNYVFSKATKLKIHMRIHTGEKPFHCQYCSKSFISMRRKKLHERYHTGEKPYECPYCKKGFATSTEYRNHVAYEERNINQNQ